MVVHEVSVEDFVDVDVFFSAEVIRVTRPKAIVKIDVSSNTPVFNKNNVNVCVSEGTGFLVSPHHVVTAQHVYALAPECGERIIIVKSKAYNLQKLASVVAAKDDVGLLKVDADFPTEMCALKINDKDVFNSQAIRFGIPGGFSEPPPPVEIRIGKNGGQFLPLILIAPATTEKGDSGGPVIHLFSVVGLMSARHEEYPAYSFMTVGSTIRTLLDANSVPSGHICNPVEARLPSFTIIGTFAQSIEHWGTTNVSKNLERNRVIGTVKLDSRLTTANSSVSPDLIKSYAKKFDDHSLSVIPDAGGALIQGSFRSDKEFNEVANKVWRTIDDVSQEVQETLWKRYVADKEKSALPETRTVFSDSPAQDVAAGHPPESAVRSGNYLVQVTSQRSEADALASYRALQKKFPPLLGVHAPLESHNEKAWLGDGWLNTGDLGYMDDDGYFWITGRA